MNPKDIRKRHILLMQHTLAILGHVLRRVSEAEMNTLRDPNDGAKGWTALEVLCHLLDYDQIFRHRAQMMLDREHPRYPAMTTKHWPLSASTTSKISARPTPHWSNRAENLCAFSRG